MEKELMNIQMTSEEYETYRNYQKELEELRGCKKLDDEIIKSTRDQYHQEFKQRQDWANRAVLAEKKLDKLLDIVHSTMPAKLRLETLVFEIEDFYKDKGCKHD